MEHAAAFIQKSGALIVFAAAPTSVKRRAIWR